MIDKKKNCDCCCHSLIEVCDRLKDEVGYQKAVAQDEAAGRTFFEEATVEFKKQFCCENFEGMFIEYPIEVAEIKCADILANYHSREKGKYVKIRLCKNGHDKKTHLGLHLGYLPIGSSISYDKSNKELSVEFKNNPAIFVFDLNEIIYGCESWWSVIQSEDDLKEITDADLDNVWYVKALQSISDK